ncbi:hypothetical protein HMPREF2626_01680 [Aerococcus sp. HMSC062A02]|uniref:hypothetical protein n=1 Tax=Aerococcus sp. HMSC062A02 TaxID=1715105 RepID=UPI0008A5141D|nr:hypothetical protein [Aerococcus sp. HMSC062A02]OFN02648.1 hypothetical protein HMPREF2626_01680 [Aerococcus sp. HMSC062A02]
MHGDAKEAWRIACFDKNKRIIKVILVGDTRTSDPILPFIVPAGVDFIKVSYPSGERMKFEKGEIATPWTPSPEDIEAWKNSIEKRISALERS